MPSELLFFRVSIFDVLQHQQEALKHDISNLDSAIIQQVPEPELVRNLAAKYKLEMPVLDVDKASMSHREIDVDVRHDPMRMIFDRGRPFYIKGLEITISVPFKGDPDLFQVRPTTFDLNPPRGLVQGNEIQLGYTRTDNNAAAAKSDYERDLQSIKQYLGWLEASVLDFNSKIGHQVGALINERKRKLEANADMISAIGLPIKGTGAQTPDQSQIPAAILEKSTNSPKKWDVFISHASEDKAELVRPLATALQQSGLSVWYDEFSLKLGDSLRGSIDYGLANSRYGVVILSPSFFSKHWTVQELNGLASKEAEGKKVILPIWHHIGADEVRQFSPMLADKLAISSNAGIERIVSEIAKTLEQQ